MPARKAPTIGNSRAKSLSDAAAAEYVLKKKLGLEVTSAKDDESGWICRPA